jgi:hydroxyethylthiazole kinase-like uncharacterized protein yjeF
MKVLLAGQMRELENLALDFGIGDYELMSKAGHSAAEIIAEYYCPSKCLVICGFGNNGGDGYICAAALKLMGVDVSVCAPLGCPRSESSQRASKYAKNAGVAFIEPERVINACEYADTIVDAIFGLGFHGSLPAELAQLAKSIEDKTIISLDIPSGLHADSPKEFPTFKADMTICFESAKPCCLMLPSRLSCGVVKVVSLGIPNDCTDLIAGIGKLITFEELAKKLPPRSISAHKGVHGRLYCVCGSDEFIGAAKLSVLSALRMGCGSVRLASTCKVIHSVCTDVNEAVYSYLQCNKNGRIAKDCIDRVLRESEHCSAMLLGCGLGMDCDTKELVCTLIEKAHCPLIIDADAINILSENPDILLSCKHPPVITAHIGEMARLSGKTADNVSEQMPQIARETAMKYNSIIVLKSASTIVSSPNGKLYYYAGGHPSLSKAGSGDALAGIIASLLAQHTNPVESAIVGVSLHGYAASCCENKYSPRSILATDIINELKYCLPLQ